MRRLTKIFAFFVLCTSSIHAFDPSSFIKGVVGKKPVVLFGDVSHREKQLKDLTTERKTLKERSAEKIRVISKKLSEIDSQTEDTNGKIKDASGSLEELLRQKLEVLNNRKQNLNNLKDFWKEVDGKIASHIKLLEEIIDALKAAEVRPEGKLIYSWKDLEEAKNKIDQLESKIVEQNAQKERLKKLRAAEKEEIASLKKDVELKNAENEKIAKELGELAEKEEGAALIAELRAKSDVLEQEISYLKEKIEVSEFKIGNFDREEQHKDAEIFLKKHTSQDLRAELLRIQKKLVIDVSDVEFAKGELEKTKKTTAEKVTQIERVKSGLKVRRDGLTNNIKFLEKRLEQIKKAGEEKTVEGYLVESRLLLMKNEKRVVDKKLDVLETDKDRLDVSVRSKELKAQIIEVLYSIGLTGDSIDARLAEFKTKLRTVEHVKKVLKDKRESIANFISSINKERETIIARQKEVVEQRDKLFRGASKEYIETITNLKRIIVGVPGMPSALDAQKSVVEKHFSQISELLVRQKDVINQYNFIIKYLESQKTEEWWKRSKRAISLDQVWQALFEGEKLFRGLFWDTPAHLGPASMFYAAREFDFDDYLGIAIFLLLFIFLFFITKALLLFIQRNIKSWVIRFSKREPYAFAVGVESLIAFLLDHFTVIFTWKFILIHVAFRATYFPPLANAYSITIFYLLSIPVLIYLSRCFIVRLRTLNQQMQFLFISQQLQQKVTTLIEFLLYATAAILPLRKAFLAYFEREVVFSVVSLAAYTLILVIIILFFLNKEDILRFLSGQNAIIVWLRKKVDRYYYPVFIFCMFLFILVNPYIGYSNLAWYLVFAVPATIFAMYGIFLIHFFLRTYSLFFFIKEEDDEVINKFEHAKAYYGLFVVMTFIVLALGAFILLARLWGVEGFTLKELWRSLSEVWVIQIGARPEDKLGLVELGKLGLFITSGLVISSLIKKFVLGKLFEIFRTESGVQNTISRILHYFIIILAIILGFTAINLSQYALTVGGLLLVGVGFGLRDQIADYFAGILVLIERPIEIGHYVEAGEYQGKVYRISARSTTLKTARNFFITIPNRDLISKPIINWGQGRYAVGCELKVTVSFDSDPALVQKVLLDMMKTHSKVLRVPAPIVRFEGFEPSALYFYCRCYISARKVLDMWDLESDLRFLLMKVFKENNIIIPYTQTVVHFAKRKDEHTAAGSNIDSKEKPKNPIEIKFGIDK